MAEYGDDERHDEGDDSGDETTAANGGANNSIIGLMRSSVSSILPNSVSKWFSPSSNNNNNNNNNNYNDSANGRHSTIKRSHPEAHANTPHAKIERRSEMVRRRIEVNDYAEDEDDGDGDGDGDCDGDDLEDQEGDESNHSDDDDEQDAGTERRRRFNFLSPNETDSHICKRPRISLDGTMLSSQPLVASTPATFSQPILNNHYGHSNFYSDQNRKEVNSNFYASMKSTTNYDQQNVAPDIIDVIPIPISSNENDTLNVRKSNPTIDTGATRSRRVLNIPPTTILPAESSYTSSTLPPFKRQSISSVKSTIIPKTDSNQDLDNQRYERRNEPIVLNPALELDEVLLTTESYNGGVQPKLQNGATEFEGELRQHSITDSEAEDNDTIKEMPSNVSIRSRLKSSTESQRVGLFNTSTRNSRSGRRTSSFGNGLNFYTHLEGRKSLFSGGNSFGNRSNLGNPLNTSTLSLNSLSRRQFNASIYGSTSALSDSRLLNTSSPFYKGNTTYGGAAAYSKYATSLGSNSRLTPTLIRPTSSLSTHSSSNNSIAAGVANSSTTIPGEQNPPISGSAKTILDILQSFATPLSEAKKMASGVRQQPSKRLCDDDLHASRVMRLQHVRKPYAREMVLLQPKNSSANKESVPPVRELQVPSMAQLLQMKKMQNQTQRSRQITMQNSYNTESFIPAQLASFTETDAKQLEIPKQSNYSIPITASIEKNTETHVFDNGTKEDCQQQKHVNKIKNKIGNTLRPGPDISDETPPIPANLPNIAFPLMAEMPKIDITLPKVTTNFSPSLKNSEEPKLKAPTTTTTITTTSKTTIATTSTTGVNNFIFSSPEVFKNKPSSMNVIEPSKMNYEFSKPTPLNETSNSGIKRDNITKTSEGSAASLLPITTNVNESKSPPTLKSGSVLEALNKLTELPKISNSMETENTISKSLQPLNAFGNQFKKASSEWECDTCMLRNKDDAKKCVACEMPRKGAIEDSSTTSTSITNLKSLANTSTNVPIMADTGFKSLAAAQKASKWECDACMAKNESSRIKCACCDQPKPGTESKKENAPAFNFGATAASKFSFGFNASAPDPAKQSAQVSNHFESTTTTNATLVEKNVNAESGTALKAGFTFGFGTGNAVVPSALSSKPNEGFSFGLQTKSMSTTDKIASTENKDTSDSATKTSGGIMFGFGNSSNTNSIGSANISKDQTPATTSTTTAPKAAAFKFGSETSTTTSATTTTETSIASTTTLTATKPQDSSPFGLSFQKVSNNSNTSPAVTTATSSLESKLTFPMFKTTPTGTAATSTTTITTFSAATTTTAQAATVAPTHIFGVVSSSATSTTTAFKPMFSFGANPVPSSTTTTSTIAPAVTTTTTTTGAVSSSSTITKSNETVGFQFTNSNQNQNPTTTKSQFSLNNNLKPTFATFAIPKIPPQSDVKNVNAITTATGAATAAVPAFGTFGAPTASTATKTENTNLFRFSAPKTPEQTKPDVAAVPIFGNVSAQADPKATTSNTWPKNAFLFGAPANTATATDPTNATSNVNVNTVNNSNKIAPKLLFGSAKTNVPDTSTTSNAPIQSIFGSMGATTSTPTFGSSGNTSAVMFGSTANSATTNTNLFANNNNNSAAPQFSAGTIGSAQTTLGNNAAANATPAFGSSASMGFGSFGSTAVTTIATSTTITQPAAPSFAFGVPQNQPENAGFNFAAQTVQTARPAFNFSATNAPTFNFSGNLTETSQNATRPFQFGATAASSINAPAVFSFGSAPSTEATSNTPFQFNAGSSQPTSNIFAPTPSTTTTTPQAARRKVRLSNRRQPPR